MGSNSQQLFQWNRENPFFPTSDSFLSASEALRQDTSADLEDSIQVVGDKVLRRMSKPSALLPRSSNASESLAKCPEQDSASDGPRSKNVPYSRNPRIVAKTNPKLFRGLKIDTDVQPSRGPHFGAGYDTPPYSGRTESEISGRYQPEPAKAQEELTPPDSGLGGAKTPFTFTRKFSSPTTKIAPVVSASQDRLHDEPVFNPLRNPRLNGVDFTRRRQKSLAEQELLGILKNSNYNSADATTAVPSSTGSRLFSRAASSESCQVLSLTRSRAASRASSSLRPTIDPKEPSYGNTPGISTRLRSRASAYYRPGSGLGPGYPNFSWPRDEDDCFSGARSVQLRGKNKSKAKKRDAVNEREQSSGELSQTSHTPDERTYAASDRAPLSPITSKNFSRPQLARATTTPWDMNINPGRRLFTRDRLDSSDSDDSMDTIETAATVGALTDSDGKSVVPSKPDGREQADANTQPGTTPSLSLSSRTKLSIPSPSELYRYLMHRQPCLSKNLSVQKQNCQFLRDIKILSWEGMGTQEIVNELYSRGHRGVGYWDVKHTLRSINANHSSKSQANKQSWTEWIARLRKKGRLLKMETVKNSAEAGDEARRPLVPLSTSSTLATMTTSGISDIPSSFRQALIDEIDEDGSSEIHSTSLEDVDSALIARLEQALDSPMPTADPFYSSEDDRMLQRHVAATVPASPTQPMDIPVPSPAKSISSVLPGLLDDIDSPSRFKIHSRWARNGKRSRPSILPPNAVHDRPETCISESLQDEDGTPILDPERGKPRTWSLEVQYHEYENILDSLTPTSKENKPRFHDVDDYDSCSSLENYEPSLCPIADAPPLPSTPHRGRQTHRSKSKREKEEKPSSSIPARFRTRTKRRNLKRRQLNSLPGGPETSALRLPSASPQRSLDRHPHNLLANDPAGTPSSEHTPDPGPGLESTLARKRGLDPLRSNPPSPSSTPYTPSHPPPRTHPRYRSNHRPMRKLHNTIPASTFEEHSANSADREARRHMILLAATSTSQRRRESRSDTRELVARVFARDLLDGDGLEINFKG